MPQESGNQPRSDIDEYVWSNHKLWVPRSLLSMHVRLGDKACEMKVVEFEEFMQLVDGIRSNFPSLNSIWLSTEMQVLQLCGLSAFLFLLLVIIIVLRVDLDYRQTGKSLIHVVKHF